MLLLALPDKFGEMENVFCDIDGGTRHCSEVILFLPEVIKEQAEKRGCRSVLAFQSHHPAQNNLSPAL